jgi:hypothetical protein
MQVVEVNVSKRLKDEQDKRTAHFPYNFPESIAEAVEVYGESATLGLLHDAITLAVQAPARKILEAAPPSEEYSTLVAKQMQGFKVHMKRSRGPSAPKVNALEEVLNQLGDPEQRDMIIERFRKLGINIDLPETP